MDKNQREARRHQEDMALNRGLLWVGGAIVLELILLLVNRYYINYRVSEAEVNAAILLKNVMGVLRVAGAAAAVLGLVWAALRFRKGQKAAIPTAAALACGAVAICSHVALAFQESGMQMLFLMVPAWAGLALIFYLYQSELFLGAAASGLAVLGLWFVRFGGMLESALCLVGIALVGAVCLWLKKNGGVVRRADGEEVRFLSKKAVYAPVLASCLAGLAAVVASMLMGANVAYYLIFAMVAWLFALMVFYTVKLM